ncbi:asparagine synthase-related protein [Burkholderiales bacterium]|nr:asparagine synthase-related protein [Burkholderiales bacterium]
MCGVHGIVCGSKNILRKMISESSSRGPGGSSFYHDAHIGLGHNLLSMSGVSSVSQPYHSQCGRYVLVFNGEIYNYKDYLDDGAYEDLGDVPVLMQLLSESHEETEVLSTLSGMYAIALYDRHNRTIFLARDTHGAKPLYYSIGENGKLIFSSEIDSLRAAGVDVSKPNIDALDIYLGLGYVPSQFTVFSKIQKIVPGGWLRYSIDKRQIVANGLVEKRKELEVASAQDYRHKLSSSVKKTADSRRKIALNLSGGLDSASILYELSVQGACVDTYTTRYVGDSKTESFKNNIDAKFAKELVAAFGTGVHNEIEINSSQYFDAAADAADALEVPDGNKSLPLYWFHTKEVSKGGVSGILSGEGADELLCGIIDTDTSPQVLREYSPMV